MILFSSNFPPNHKILGSCQNHKIVFSAKIAKCFFSAKIAKQVFLPKFQNVFSHLPQNHVSRQNHKNLGSLPNLQKQVFCKNCQTNFTAKIAKVFSAKIIKSSFSTKATKTSFLTKIDKFCYPINTAKSYFPL